MYPSLSLLLVYVLSLSVFVFGQTPGVPHGGGACSTDYDCSLGGTCGSNGTDTVCFCDPWFTGSSCALLNLQRPRFDDQAGTCGDNFASYYSWGGKAVQVSGDSTYHLYASFMCRHANLGSWTTASSSAHFTSDTVDGAYSWASTDCVGDVCSPVVIPWSHNTVIALNPTSPELTLFHIGDGIVNPSEWAPCFNLSQVGVAGDEAPPVPAAEEGFLPPSTLRAGPGNTAYVATADAPNGPWTRANNNSGVFINFTGSWTSALAGNPAPLIFPNGSALLYFTATPCPPNSGALAPNCITVATADSWDGPYTMNAAPHPITYPESEDPYVWQDPRGNFHMFTNVNTCHQRCGQGVPCGGHAWSSDGFQFSNLTVGAFGPVITFRNDSVWQNAYVERPLVTLAADGRTPLAFHVGMGRAGYLDSCNWVQLFCTNASDPTCGPTTLPPPPPKATVKVMNGGQCLIIFNASSFPCSGSGNSQGCPLVMGDCSDPSAVWITDASTIPLPSRGGGAAASTSAAAAAAAAAASPLMSAHIVAEGGGAVGIDVDCDSIAPSTIIKALSSSFNSFLVQGGVFQVVEGGSGAISCINTGQGSPNPPCGPKGELYLPNQIKIATSCQAAEAQGWSIVAAS